MPCNSDYLEPTSMEISLSRIFCLIDELAGHPMDRDRWLGCHPLVYGTPPTKEYVDGETRRLCGMLRMEDVRNYSLEMQIWWRDHQQADAERIEEELKKAKTEHDREELIESLTSYELELLCIKK